MELEDLCAELKNALAGRKKIQMNLFPPSIKSESPDDYCEQCMDTGCYGDNGPGIRGNRVYRFCDCNPAARALRNIARWLEKPVDT